MIKDDNELIINNASLVKDSYWSHLQVRPTNFNDMKNMYYHLHSNLGPWNTVPVLWLQFVQIVILCSYLNYFKNNHNLFFDI